MSLAMFAPATKTTPVAEPTGLAPNSFRNQMYGPNASVPVRSGPVDFNASSLASQLAANFGKQSPAPAAAPAPAAPTGTKYPSSAAFEGPFAQFFKAIYDREDPATRDFK